MTAPPIEPEVGSDHCALCALGTSDLLFRLAWHDFVDEAQESHAVNIALRRTGLAQRALAERIAWAQASVSKAQRFPRPLPRLPGWVTVSRPPDPTDDECVSSLELWCAYKAAWLGWVPSFQHRIRWGPGQPRTWPRCDVVLSPPGEWQPTIAVEVRRDITSTWELEDAISKVTERYADPLGCRPLVVAYRCSVPAPSGLVISPWALESEIGPVGPPYQPTIQPPPVRRRPPRDEPRYRRPRSL